MVFAVRITLRLFAFMLITAPASLAAHEFWISPLNYVIEPGEQAEANLHVGEDFIGPAYSYQTRQFERFEVISGDTVTPVEGRLGDVPALKVDGLPDGLAIIVHETIDNSLSYKTWAKFKKFVDHKAMDGVLDAHISRGIRQENFREDYRRFAKSLLAVGSGAGADRPVGLTTEIVALDNPYTDTLSEMRVQILLNGAPRANAQVELFDRDTARKVTVHFHRTDSNGIATFPIRAGHEYLVDAVAMEALPNDDPDDGAVWRSLWAALTFSVPGAPLN